ncbi:MAG: hypothetical protein OET79_10255, partial [Nitrospirota bacterium]|nr:hypothetical protein [Nitrospirota bacterium]
RPETLHRPRLRTELSAVPAAGRQRASTRWLCPAEKNAARRATGQGICSVTSRSWAVIRSQSLKSGGSVTSGQRFFGDRVLFARGVRRQSDLWPTEDMADLALDRRRPPSIAMGGKR